MKTPIALLILASILGIQFASAQNADIQSVKAPMKMELQGSGVADRSLGTIQSLPLGDLGVLTDGMPTHELSKLVQTPMLEAAGTSRSAKDAQIYRAISPSVVLVATKEGIGSGSLVDSAGDILTNWHVVSGNTYVAIIFKPNIEGKEPTRDEAKLGHVVLYDEVADLALVKSAEVPTNRTPLRLGDSSEISVGVDVHAIGHPLNETWTYTTGIISQYRQAYEWQEKGSPIKHKADVIQTQTPISPGNSGGPLLSDSGALIGVNSFKAVAGEGLNFAVSIDEVKRFLARPKSRIAQENQGPKSDTACKLKELSRFRNKVGDASVISYDMFCTGKDSAEYVVPDDKTQAILFRIDRNSDGNVDLVVFDFKRNGKWDLSFWDEKFEGHWTLVGYHDDGTLKPTRFESYAEFQKRVASR